MPWTGKWCSVPRAALSQGLVAVQAVHTLLDRDGWRCAECSRPGKLEVSHVIPVWKRPDLELVESNVRVLCRSCHLKADRKPISPETVAWRALVADMLE